MEGYCTDVYYDNALAFIDGCRAENEPFFIYLPDNCPHGPFHDVPQAEYEMYKDMDNSRMEKRSIPVPCFQKA